MPRSAAALRTERIDEPVGGRVELRYVARAGLLPELSRQTYDRFYKAIREAVLNAIDAGAKGVEIDFRRVAEAHELVVMDDGDGMSTAELCENFMSVGGSPRFGDSRRYGRIGIGSLALLQYGSSAVIETKKAGATVVTRATIDHPWAMSRDARRSHLGDLAAGVAEEFPYQGSRSDHFTRISLQGTNAEVATVSQDPTAYYALMDDLRRVLPLAWGQSPVVDSLRKEAKDVAATLDSHVAEWSIPVVVHGPWETDVTLTRRFYGDDRGSETWNDRPVVVSKTLSIVDEGGRRRQIGVHGFLISQRRAIDAWSGLTARVQNVAVEERTFFDVTADAGFRKYITGEIWITGDVDRERLINIDRSSFNRESEDYRALQRFLGRAIIDFKSRYVQRPQRLKVEARRAVERYTALVEGAALVLRAAEALVDAAATALPSSEPRRLRRQTRVSLVDLLNEMTDVTVSVAEDLPDRARYKIDPAGEGLHAVISSELADPRVSFRSSSYRVSLVRDESAPPVVIRNKPREIVFNIDHPAHAGPDFAVRHRFSFALELAYLLHATGDPAALYDSAVELMGAV